MPTQEAMLRHNINIPHRETEVQVVLLQKELKASKK